MKNICIALLCSFSTCLFSASAARRPRMSRHKQRITASLSKIVTHIAHMWLKSDDEKTFGITNYKLDNYGTEFHNVPVAIVREDARLSLVMQEAKRVIVSMKAVGNSLTFNLEEEKDSLTLYLRDKTRIALDGELSHYEYRSENPSLSGTVILNFTQETVSSLDSDTRFKLVQAFCNTSPWRRKLQSAVAQRVARRKRPITLPETKETLINLDSHGIFTVTHNNEKYVTKSKSRRIKVSKNAITVGPFQEGRSEFHIRFILKKAQHCQTPPQTDTGTQTPRKRQRPSSMTECVLSPASQTLSPEPPVKRNKQYGKKRNRAD